MTDRNDRIEAALAALDKATPGPLEVQESRDGGATYSLLAYDEKGAYVVASVNCLGGAKEGVANSNIFAAAPDLAAEVIRLRKIIATLSRCANKLEMDGVARMSAEERGKWLDKQVEEIETRDENIAEGYGLERKWFAESEEE